jgi:predicted aminopeptidase
MALLKLTAAAAALALLAGCQAPYIVDTAFSQAELLASREPIEKVLSEPDLTAEQKQKLRLAADARDFGQNVLGLKKTGSYHTYVQLKRPYVSYVVSASPKNELKHYTWWFPIVGNIPYIGYPRPESAHDEAEVLKKKGLDTYVRGVSAYSTLGWFDDPVLSSMLRYKEFDLVNTIIHESTHATIYIKSAADFNERLAVFIGNKGTEEFYKAREGADSKTLGVIAAENRDEQLFSDFISREIKSLETWYTERKSVALDESVRMARLHEIQKHFAAELKPKLKSDSFAYFETMDLNNARLLNFKLYQQDLSDFQKAFDRVGHDFHKMIAFCKSLESQKDPEAYLHAYVN